MIWKDKYVQPNPALTALEASLNSKVPFPAILTNLLVQRGFSSVEAVREFLQPDLERLHSPFLFKDMEKAVARILLALENREKILLYGDYDVDGTTSVTLMKLFFADWGIEVPYYIPDRYSEGYGISYQGVEHARSLGSKLLVTLDCGAKAMDKIRFANELGIDVIVVDHHTVGSDAPPCFAMINPRQPDCPYPFKELPACGLALKLAEALSERMELLGDLVQIPPERDVVARYRDLVSLAIASDIVPLTGENRIIAAHGLKKLREAPLPGIAALKRLSTQERAWQIEDLVFFIGPRINSAGRLYSAREAVELLMGKGPEINEFAATLHDYNQERKDLEDVIHKEASAMISEEALAGPRSATVLWSENWSKGVIGIVASRLIERNYRPTVILTESNGKWVGSARSVDGFDLYAALEACSEYLVQFGGHKYAAGLTMDKEQLVPFKEAFEAYVAATVTEAQKQPCLEIAGELHFSQIDERLIRQVRFFGPFGPENTEPVFIARNVEVQSLRILKDAHVRLQVGQGGIGFEAIGFNLAWRWAEVNSTRIDLAFQPDLKTYNNKTYIQLKIKDLRLPTSS